MKAKLFYTLLTCIVIGIVIPTFAGSLGKDQGDKTKTDNLPEAPPPPPTWTLHIHVMDPPGSCDAQTCNLRFIIQPATLDCHGIYAIPAIPLPYDPEQTDYYQQIPVDIHCVIVSIIDDPVGFCPYPFNNNTCCECEDSNDVCKLHICP
jgi:hypothetical protein